MRRRHPPTAVVDAGAPVGQLRCGGGKYDELSTQSVRLVTLRVVGRDYSNPPLRYR
jgi:hypothetical protein